MLLNAIQLFASTSLGHEEPIATLVFFIAVILVAANIGGDLASRAGQPAVLGELMVGVILGNVALMGIPWFDSIKIDPGIDTLAKLGVLLLLFEVGLESTVPQMLKVGLTSLIVALLGVVTPFLLGFLLAAWLMPEASIYAHAFVGATLCATSVGITARVLQDLGKSKTKEARIILGAAVIDDVLGLIVLAVVSGLIVGANSGIPVSLFSSAAIFFKAALFLFCSVALGVWLSPKLFSLASRLHARGVLLAVGLSFCFLLSWLAAKVGLASIVGAFAAGLILEDTTYQSFKERGEKPLEDLIHPIVSFLSPIFFVIMGMRTDLRSLAEPGMISLALILTVAAIIGKQISSLGVIGKDVNKISIGIGMIPRGEVGLIFANIGLGLTIGGEPIISKATYSGIVVMVIFTTVITPPALKWSFSRKT
jgi:Na+:H+ antiporter